MAEIKISDLSIGDWVRHTFYEENLQIKRIDGESERLLVEKGRMSVSCHLDQFEPIPLTPEILEKNGFVDGVPKGEAYKLGINDDMWLFRNDECWDFRIYYNFYSEGIILTKLWIKHTHQLQHALRLAGVEKEIEV